MVGSLGGFCGEVVGSFLWGRPSLGSGLGLYPGLGFSLVF